MKNIITIFTNAFGQPGQRFPVLFMTLPSGIFGFCETQSWIKCRKKWPWHWVRTVFKIKFTIIQTSQPMKRYCIRPGQRTRYILSTLHHDQKEDKCLQIKYSPKETIRLMFAIILSRIWWAFCTNLLCTIYWVEQVTNQTQRSIVQSTPD